MKKLLMFIFTILVISNLYGHDRDYIQWWIYNHGDYTKTEGKNDPLVKQASDVFKRVKNAADKAEARIPRLFIINTKGNPYALALPDGSIVINPTTLNMCYEGTKKGEGDRRLAFILGHELAHLANKDFMHRESFLALRKYGDKKAREELIKYFELSNPEKAKEFKKRELYADQKGTIYATMAGYRIGSLFWGENNFLRYWAEQIGMGYVYDETFGHPAMEKRVQFVRTHLKAVLDKVELFRAGVLLFQAGSYRDSAAAFLEFSKVYPAREVFNNIGACYLNLAVRHLYLKFSDDYFSFRLSTAIDYSTGAELLHLRGEGDYLKDKEISRYLDKAEDFFKLAAERDHLDRACRYNLTAVSILKKEYAEALAVCSDILKINPGDADALNNKAVAFYNYGREEDVETTQKAIQLLQKANKIDPGNFKVLYNLASIKQKRERRAGARLYWEKYLNLSYTPKDNYYNYVYEKLHKTAPPKPEERTGFPKLPAGISFKDTFSIIKKRWGKEDVKEFKLGNAESENSDSWLINLQVIVKNNVRVLALDGTIEMVEKEYSPLENLPEILKRFGQPQKVVCHSNGNFYVYKDKGFSIKEINGKVRSYIWFEKDF
jgi:tetratricopeptide (TPR) repeat protein